MKRRIDWVGKVQGLRELSRHFLTVTTQLVPNDKTASNVEKASKDGSHSEESSSEDLDHRKSISDGSHSQRSSSVGSDSEGYSSDRSYRNRAYGG